MILKVYSKRNTKLGIFENMVFQPHEPDVIKEMIRRSVIVASTPREGLDADYFLIGSFDDASGVLTAEPTPKFLFSLTEFLPLYDLTHGNVAKEGEQDA